MTTRKEERQRVIPESPTKLRKEADDPDDKRDSHRPDSRANGRLPEGGEEQGITFGSARMQDAATAAFCVEKRNRVIITGDDTVPVPTKAHQRLRSALRGLPYLKRPATTTCEAIDANLSWIRMCYPHRRHERPRANSKTYLLHVLKSK